MKKQFNLLVAAVALALSVSAAPGLPERSMGGSMKRLNAKGYALTASRSSLQSAVLRTAPDNAVEVPFMHTLGKAADQKPNTDLYKDFDVNEDAKGWKVGGFNGYSACTGPSLDNNDDWMISPPIHLLAGVDYEMTYTAGVNTPDGKKAFAMDVCMGQAQEPSAMTVTLVPSKDYKEKETVETIALKVDADGYYCVGFHSTTAKATTGIGTLKNFGISAAGVKVDPPAAGTLEYVVAPKGELKATVTYTAPTLTVSGADLERISKVVITTCWTDKHVFDNVTPGEKITLDVDMYQGSSNNRIEAVAYVDDTAGETVLVKDIFAGFDTPLPPANPVITLSDDYKSVTVSWDPVGETGEHGGYVDPSSVTYYIFDAFGSYYDPALAATTGTSYTFDYSDVLEQDFVAYQITAGIEDLYLYSLETVTDICVIGEPDALPFTESFAGAYYSQMWMVDPESSSGGYMAGTLNDNEIQTNVDDDDAEPEYLNSQDGDNGFFIFLPMEKDAAYGFSSVKIDLSKAAHPVFDFMYQGKGSVIDVKVAAANGPLEVIKTIDLKENPTEGWTLCRVDLSEYKSAGYIRIGVMLRAVHNTDDTTWSVPLDNMRVMDLVETDLRIVTCNAPTRLAPGTTASIDLRIENLGTAPCENAVAVLTIGDKVTETPVPAIEPLGFASVSLPVSATAMDADELECSIDVKAEGDANPDNNRASGIIKVLHPSYPVVADLSATVADNDVLLEWSAPDFSAMTEAKSVVEDFENEGYAPLTIENFGGWTLYDGDKGKTYTFLDDTANPYRTDPMAFQLYDPVKAGVPAESLIDAEPHSGSTMLVAWSTKGTNDNWLISPELSGDAQTISFWAKSFTIGWAESFEVLYSTGGTDPDDFILIEEVENYPADNRVPEDWTEFKAALPEGALHFAIRHNAYDTYALYIDDISFAAAPDMPADTRIDGYNIYRDGVKLNETPVEATEMLDTPDDSGTYTYHVTTVYSCGESRVSAPVEVIFEKSGAEAPVADGISIVADAQTIVITGAEGRHVAVNAVDGRCIFSGCGHARTLVPASQGVYIVTIDKSCTAKIIIR
ncbi:MAG: choice-of-anchor J domain-containing protein [Muribaculaceae bacterium]|nr:choice-of-anchor J domain-containing protein [Muribaculaceae bacterium]